MNHPKKLESSAGHPVGARVRVKLNAAVAVGTTLSHLHGSTGTIAATADRYGRLGVKLDDHPRKQAHWLWWFVPEYLESIHHPEETGTE